MLIRQRSYLVLAIIIFIVKCKAWDLTPPQDLDNQCAQIFLQPHFQGAFFRVRDNEQLSDLFDLVHYVKVEEIGQENKNLTDYGRTLWSFKIKNGCNLKLSLLPSLKGEVENFGADEEALEMMPKSVACECPKSCKCDDLNLRQSECARAYLHEDCSNCQALFTSLKHTSDGNWTDFPEKWAFDVKNIVVREGCHVKFQQGNDNLPFGQAHQSSDDNVPDHKMKFDITGMVTQYSCTCSNDTDVQQVGTDNADDENENYPKLLNVPRTKGRINALFFNEELRRHPGLLASLQSLRSHKSSRNAYILLLGLTGSGKSSAVNLLFDNPITKVGDFVSTTTDIIQFSIPIPLPELGLNNTALHVIDTPGIGDTRGFSQDSRFLATLEDFLDKHEDLKRREPNVVLIFAKFSDNRFRGEGSKFVKMLRTIDLFKERIIDKKSTNVIFVLTHYMSETKELTKDPQERIQSIREVIEEFSTLPRPIHIVLAENKPEEYQLPSINGFWELPNGDFYPKNLFDQMQRNLIDSEDPIGEAVIRKAFSNSDNFKITGKRFPMLASSEPSVTKYLGVLASFTKPVVGTDVSAELNKAYEQVDQEVKQRYPGVLGALQRTLYRNSMVSLTDLPRTTKEILKLMEKIQLNPLSLLLMDKAFNISVPKFTKDFVVGSGYSLVRDRSLPAKIFETDTIPNAPSEIMFRIPEAYQVALSHGLDNQVHVFTSMAEYITGRMIALGLSPEVIPMNSYSSSPSNHPGFNLISLKDDLEEGVEVNENEVACHSLSATVDYHTFEIELTSEAKLSKNFLEDLDKLQPLNLTDEVNVKTWTNFFDMYGTHVVTHAFGGGSIQIKVEISQENQSIPLKNSQKLSVLSEAMAEIVQQLADDLIGKHSVYDAPPQVKYELVQVGGSHKHFWRNFSESDETKNIDEWRESLWYEPEILTSRLKLVPISKIVRKIGENIELSDMIEQAAFQLLNASLIFIPIERISRDGPESRDSLDVSMVSRGDYESLQQFAEMFKMMSAANQEMQKQVLIMISETQAKSDLEQQRYQEQLLLLKKEQLEREMILREEERHKEQMSLRLEQLEMERVAKERALEAQLHQNTLQMELQQRAMMEQVHSQNQQMLLQLLNSENNRRTQLTIAKMNRKSWWQKGLCVVTIGLYC